MNIQNIRNKQGQTKIGIHIFIVVVNIRNYRFPVAGFSVNFSTPIYGPGVYMHLKFLSNEDEKLFMYLRTVLIYLDVFTFEDIIQYSHKVCALIKPITKAKYNSMKIRFKTPLIKLIFLDLFYKQNVLLGHAKQISAGCLR